MSDRRRKAKLDIDYAIFHKTGRKVTKANKTMDLTDRKVKEMQISEDISETFAIFALQDLDTEQEICEGLDQINDIGKQYRHIHVELKELLGEQVHADTYKNYGETCKNIRKFVKDSKVKIKLIQQEEKEKEAQRQEEERKIEVEKKVTARQAAEDIVRDTLRIEEQVFQEKIRREIEKLDFDHCDSEELKIICKKFEILSDEYYKLLSKVKIGFGVSYEEEWGKQFENTLSQINNFIKKGWSRLKEISAKEQEISIQVKMENDEHIKKNFLEEQKFQAEILYKEIEMRCTSIFLKCKTSSLKTMSDHEILDRNKSLNSIDTEMREIFDKVSGFAKIAVLCGNERDTMLIRPRDLQEKALECRNAYAMELYSIFVERDISEEKLRNSTGLTITLEKFKGYGSKLDIYSFRSEFEKLIQPNVLKRHWVDTLKNNYLAGSALTLVEKSEDIDEIWKKLVGAYGNVKLMLQNKISLLDKFEHLDKIKGDEKLCNALAKIVNMMLDLSNLAQKHDLEYKLYIGGGLEKVLSLIGEKRERKFVSKNLNQTDAISKDVKTSNIFAEKLEWQNLVKFLEKELALCEKLTLLQKSKECLGQTPKPLPKVKDKYSSFGGSAHASCNTILCHICGGDNHVVSIDQNGARQIDYFSCKKFVEMSPKIRRLELQKKGFCLQCLSPGMKYDEKHTCYKKYCCPDSYHAKYPKGLHVLVCEAHKKNQSNIFLLEDYKKSVISKRSKFFENFTKNISLVCCSENLKAYSAIWADNANTIPDVKEKPIFMLQTIDVGGVKLKLFFDNGCFDMVIKKSAIDALQSLGRAKQVVPGPIIMSGVGDQKTISDHGIFSICVPLTNGRNAILSGVCLDTVTFEFPTYKLKEVENDVRKQCKKDGGDLLLNKVPRLPQEVGGDADILIGIQYARYHPKKVWESLTGLFVSESPFLGADGTTGVIGGPHPVFSKTERQHRNLTSSNLASSSYFTSSVNLYRYAYSIRTFTPFLNSGPLSDESPCGKYQQNIIDSQYCKNVFVARKPPKCVRIFDEIDNAGTEVTFRCVDCRNCKNCKTSQRVDSISIQEEIEQSVIERNVEVDLEKCKTTCMLPFVSDPDTQLVSNEKIALRVYEGQTKLLADKLEDKESVIKSEGKLQELGFVEYFSNLPKEDQDRILENLKYFIPWRAIWNLNSQTTPCRLVFDASLSPRGKCALNNLLAKGTNNMNNLIAILIRWMTYLFVFHTDISKMYNTIWLNKVHWRYQMYLWDSDLRLNVSPVWKVIKTAIYGVRSSGNVAECGLRKTAELTKKQCPVAYDVIMNDIYVDDCLSGENSLDSTYKITDQLSVALAKGGFKLKGFTFSGEDPPEHLCNDGEKFITVAGLKWHSKVDSLGIAVPKLNFSKKQRGKKSKNMEGMIPENLTKRNCVSAVYEVFDPLGKVTPIMSRFKMDLNELTLRKLDWDDKIPDDLRKIWESNFEMIQEIGNIRYNRAVVPVDAVDLNMQTIDAGDASPKMICVAIYVRFKRKSGDYSCQLLFSRSKVVPKDMSMPRAELLAAEINACTGHIVKTALGDRHVKCWKLTDSQVVLYWIGCVRTKLKMWVRNRVIEINRLVDVADWWYVESENNPADIGTRKGATIVDVGPDSVWINGMSWIRLDESEFPLKSIAEIVLDSNCQREANKERIIVDVINDFRFHLNANPSYASAVVPNAVGDRYSYSRYIIDPNRFRFRKVIRVLGLCIMFIDKLLKRVGNQNVQIIKYSHASIPKQFKSQGDQYLVTTGNNSNPMVCKGGLVVDLTENMINAALEYYFRKASEEVKHFLPKSKYKNISEEKNDVLYYTGRILPMQEISGKLTLCDVSLDLTKSTFCVPIIDSKSPIAYSIANEIHWYHRDVKHGGVESLLRQVNCVSYIIDGRQLVKSIKNACIVCRLLEKRGIKVAMGPMDESNLCIAPAFHSTQVDICGPFESYPNSNKRAKIKIWFVVFCCSTTGAIDCKVMEDYSSDSFVLAFIRFSCRYGYPCILFPDYGSQLIKGCKDMTLSFSDIKHKLGVEYGVEFRTCPVGAHNFHGKVERKIQSIKKSIQKECSNARRSIIQWETLGQQIANSINNLPIGLGNKTESLENLEILTPNRLLLGRNNNRCPTAPLILSRDLKKIMETNAKIFSVWFKSWLVSYVPSLVPKPKWFENDRAIAIGDVVLFSKSEKEFENLYQYGMIKSVYPGNDNRIRSVEIEYKNANEDTKRTTKRGVRDLVVIHPVDELGISKELFQLSKTQECNICVCHG